MDKNILIEKVNSKETKGLNSDDEYYYAVGQCVQFMVKRYTNVNKGLNAGIIATPVLISKNIPTLQTRIKNLYMKVNKTLFMNDTKFNNCMVMVLGYMPENHNVNHDLMNLGFLENSILQ